MRELPPFPFLPASPEERLRLTQYGELCARMAVEAELERVCRWLESHAITDAPEGVYAKPTDTKFLHDGKRYAEALRNASKGVA